MRIVNCSDVATAGRPVALATSRSGEGDPWASQRTCAASGPSRSGVRWLLSVLLLAGCATRVGEVDAPSAPAAKSAASPTTTRGEFLVEAGGLDTWNAVGQIAVRAPGVTYEGRAQMLGLYALRYRGESLMVLTRPLLAAETAGRLTTRVTATTPAGKPVDSDAAADLLGLLQRELPAEIEDVRRRQAAEKAGTGRARKARR